MQVNETIERSHWKCPTCGNDGTSPYCGECGERRLTAADGSVKHYVDAAAESVFSWDGRIVATLASFLRRPGELTNAYLEGRRKPFLNPLQLFLLINVLFFVQQGVTGWNTYSTPFRVHVSQSPYAGIAKALARVRFDQLGIAYEGRDAEAFVQRFNATVNLSAKSLVVLLVPLVTLVLAAVRLGRPRQPVMHVTAGMHLTAYFVALQTVVLPCLTGLSYLQVVAGTPMRQGAMDELSLVSMLVGMFVLIIPMLKRVYGATRLSAALQAAVISALLVWCVQGYRLILFVLTLFTTT
jgi:hypothetical protein